MYDVRTGAVVACLAAPTGPGLDLDADPSNRDFWTIATALGHVDEIQARYLDAAADALTHAPPVAVMIVRCLRPLRHVGVLDRIRSIAMNLGIMDAENFDDVRRLGCRAGCSLDRVFSGERPDLVRIPSNVTAHLHTRPARLLLAGYVEAARSIGPSVRTSCSGVNTDQQLDIVRAAGVHYCTGRVFAS